MSLRISGLVAIAVLLLTAPTAFAASSVPIAYHRVAAAHGIPSAVFYAVALAESGKSIDRCRAGRPWPWTLNVEGEGRYFETRQAALEALRVAIESGRVSVDIGVMQVNWKYHANALGSMEAALDPYRNLDVAAGILVDCYRKRGDWWAAVGCYHAPNHRRRAVRYRERVKAIWSKLVSTG